MKSVFSILILAFFSCQSMAQISQDEQVIYDLVQTMATGWCNGNGEQFASVFADGHDFIVWNGLYSKGATVKENAMAHQRIFDTIYKGTNNYMTVDKIRFIRPDLALIHVFAAVTKKEEGRPKDPMVLFTGIVDKSSGQWKVISFHNLDLEVYQDENLKANFPVAPELMYASWYADKE